MKPLRASNGRAVNVRLDFETREQLKHLRLFIATHMNLQVSDSVLVRRAIDLLTADHYEKLIRATWVKGKEQTIEDEVYKLKSIARGSTWERKLRPVNVLDKFPTWSQRIKERSEYFANNWLDELDAAERRRGRDFQRKLQQIIKH